MAGIFIWAKDHIEWEALAMEIGPLLSERKLMELTTNRMY